MHRYRVPLGFLLGFCYLIIARWPSSRLLLGTSGAGVLAGCLLRSWAAGYLLKGKRVAVGGPYAYIRNPLYVGSLLIGLGFCLALWQKPLPWLVRVLWGSFAVGFFVLYRFKSAAEERELIQALGEPYARYRERVPAFLPWRGRVPDLGSQRFSWEIYRRNKEYQCGLGAGAVALAVALKAYYGF